MYLRTRLNTLFSPAYDADEGWTKAKQGIQSPLSFLSGLMPFSRDEPLGRGVGSLLKVDGQDQELFYYSSSKKWAGKHPFSLKIKQESGWPRAHPTHPAPIPLLGYCRSKEK